MSGVSCNGGNIPSSPAGHTVSFQVLSISCYCILAGRTTLEQRTCFSLMYLYHGLWKHIRPLVWTTTGPTLYDSGPPYTHILPYTAIHICIISPPKPWQDRDPRDPRDPRDRDRDIRDRDWKDAPWPQLKVRVLKFVKVFQAWHFQSWDTIVYCSILYFSLIYNDVLQSR